MEEFTENREKSVYKRRSSSSQDSFSRSRSRSKSRKPKRARHHSKRSRSRSQHRSRCKCSRRSTTYSRSPSYHRRMRYYGTRENPNKSRILGVFGLSCMTSELKLMDIFDQFGAHFDNPRRKNRKISRIRLYLLHKNRKRITRSQ